MPYNEEIDARIRKIVTRWKSAEAKKMFGGVCHLLNGNMVCGVYKETDERLGDGGRHRV